MRVKMFYFQFMPPGGSAVPGFFPKRNFFIPKRNTFDKNIVILHFQLYYILKIKQAFNYGGNLMKKSYTIEVDCANCANLMEEATKKTEGVAGAVVNFMTQKMEVEFADGADEKSVMKAVLKACKKVEPDCEIEL